MVKAFSSESSIVSTFHISLVAFNLEHFLSLSLTFISLTLLKIPGQLFCRMAFTLHLSDVLFMIRIRLSVYDRTVTKVMIVF